MTDEHKLIRDSARASQAQSLLENELIAEAFATLETDYTSALFLTKPEDGLSREKLYLAVNVVRKVKDHLNSVIANGKLAAKELEDLANTAERKKRFGII